MARGQQKIQAQQKAAEKAAKLKKAAGNSKADNLKTAQAGLKTACKICMVRKATAKLRPCAPQYAPVRPGAPQRAPWPKK